MTHSDKYLDTLVCEPFSDLENSFNSIQQTADLALTDVIRDIGDTSINRRITDAFFKATLLAQVTQFSRQMASVAVSQQLQEDLLLVSDEFKTNKPTAEGNKARLRLNEQGLKNLFSGRKFTTKGVKYPKGKKGKKPTAKQIAKYESDIALQQQEVVGGINLTGVEQEAIAWAESNINEEQAIAQFKLLGQPVTDEVATQRFEVEGEPPVIIRKALAKTIDEIIMSPNVVNRPLWMSNPHYALVAQLKGFMMVFGNTIGPKVYKEVIKPLMPVHMKREGGIGVNIPTAITRPVETFEGTFKYGLTFALLLSAMYGTQIMKNAIRYEDADDSPLADLENSELMFKLLQQSNLLGFGNTLISAAESEKYGQSPISTILGPVAGKIEQLMRGLYNLKDGRPRSLANWLAKNTPFTGGLGTERRADVPIVGTDAFEEYLESFLDTVDMAEGGSIMDSLLDMFNPISKANVGEEEALKNYLGQPQPVEIAPVLPNVISEVEENGEDIPPMPDWLANIMKDISKKPEEDRGRTAPLPPEKGRTAPLPPEKFPDNSFKEALALSESSRNYNSVNPKNYMGKYQFGNRRLTDFKKATKKNFTKKEFLKNPKLQEEVYNYHAKDINKFINDNELDFYIGKKIKNILVTRNGLTAVAHLGGKNGMRKFLQTGGKYNPEDSNGTSLSDYLNKFKTTGIK